MPPLASPRLSSLARAALAAGLLAGAPSSLAQPPADSDSDSPRDSASDSPRDSASDSPRASDAPRASPESGDMPSGHPRMPGMSGVPASFPEDAPLSTGARVAHAASPLLPLGTLFAAYRLSDAPLGHSAAGAGAGMIGASLPARLLFLRVSPGGRWQELEVAAFGAGLVLTPTLAALGTWGLGELAFEGSPHRGRAFLWALGGASAGMVLGVVTYEVLDRLAGTSQRLEWLRRWVTLGLIGAGASAGYQWGAHRRRSESSAPPPAVPE